jgi:hypothetical protein
LVTLIKTILLSAARGRFAVACLTDRSPESRNDVGII